MQRTTKYYIRIVNWDELQHYKTRQAPWVKLYNYNLHSRWWVECTDATRALAIALMLLAPSTRNRVPLDLHYIQTIAHLHEEPNIAALVTTGFAEVINEQDQVVSWPAAGDASSVLAGRKQGASDVLANDTPDDASNLLERRDDTTTENGDGIKIPDSPIPDSPDSGELPAKTFAPATPSRGEFITDDFDMGAIRTAEARLKAKKPITPELAKEYERYVLAKHAAVAAN